MPRATLRRTRPSDGPGTGWATPTSTTTTDARTWRPRTLMAAPPAQKLATIWAVTSDGQGVTPACTTPWSPANTAIVTGSGTGGGQVRAMAANWAPMVSRRPSEPAGLVRRSWSSKAARWAPASGRSTLATRAAKRPSVMSHISCSLLLGVVPVGGAQAGWRAGVVSAGRPHWWWQPPRPVRRSRTGCRRPPARLR